MHEPTFLLRAGRLLRSAANDLKRDDRTAESDLGLADGAFADLTSGRTPVTWDLIARASRVWPLNERDLLPIHDDCPDGVRVHCVADSLASSRVTNRGGSPYYEYRDTAMSRIASYRPEWIRMMRVVDDADPENPAVEWNRGHLLYQFTYFVGPVNYYYRWEGVSHCVEMNTGDSVWGLPFAPHSFTSRSQTEPAYILALTYGGELLGDTQRELSILGPAAARDLALPTHDGALLASFLRARLMSEAELAHRTGLDVALIGRFCRGEAVADSEHIGLLARALGVSVRDLLPPQSGTKSGVHIQQRADANRWEYPSSVESAYRLTQLAGDPTHPHTTAVELEVSGDARHWLTTHQHQYAFVLEDAPVRLTWLHRGRQQSTVLAAGDSCYILPQTQIAWTAEGGTARVLLLRIGGAATTDVRLALGAMPGDGIERYLDEDGLWYRTDNGEGKR